MKKLLLLILPMLFVLNGCLDAHPEQNGGEGASIRTAYPTKEDLNGALSQSNTAIQQQIQQAAGINVAKLEDLAKLVAELKVTLKDLDVQAGIGNKIDKKMDEITQKLSAGHDVNNTTTQFNENMLAALKNANDTTVRTNQLYALVLICIVLAAAGIVIAMFHAAKNKAEFRATVATNELKAKQMQFERALAILPPAETDKIFDSSRPGQ